MTLIDIFTSSLRAEWSSKHTWTKSTTACISRYTVGRILTLCGFYVSPENQSGCRTCMYKFSFPIFPSLDFDVFSVYLCISPRFSYYTHFYFLLFWRCERPYEIFLCFVSFPLPITLRASCYSAVRCALVSVFLPWPTLLQRDRERERARRWLLQRPI